MNLNSIKENLNLDILDPKTMIKNMIITFVFYLIKICILGYVIYFIYDKTGLLDDRSIKNYLIFLFVGSIGLYIITFLYFMYKCYNNGVDFSVMDYKGYAISSLLAPSFIISYSIFLFVVGFIKVTPLIGKVLYDFTSVSILIILTTGVAYNIGFEIAYTLTKCSKT